MKRWILTLQDYKYKPLIYAETVEKAIKVFSGEIVLSAEPYTNIDYLNNIEFIKSHMTLIATHMIPSNRIREWYEVSLESGMLRVRLYKDNTDGLYYDIAEYQFKSNDTLIYPITFTYSNPSEVENLFFGTSLKCEIPTYRIYGQPALKKPTELKGIKQSFSVEFIPNKCKCQCFVNGNDLWIKHRDFFSTSHRPSQNDIGTPLTYRAEKYFGVSKSYLDKFVYKDSWGDIILRNEAWIVFRNFKPIIERTKPYPITVLMKTFLESDVLKQNHITELNIDWKHFFEKLCKEYINYIWEKVQR